MHHRWARSEVASCMPDDLSLGPGVGISVSIGTGFDEIGSEDDLFSVFMDIEKISSGFAAAASGGSDRDHVAESSSPPCPKHRHNSSVDGSGLFAAARKDDTTPLAEVMEAKKAMSPEQLAAIDPKHAKSAPPEAFACKSISKKKLRTTVDIEDVRREVEIMRHLPKHPNIVTLRDTYEDDNAVHLIMELCEGGELFDRIVARGHYTERAAMLVTRTIVEVVQMCHKHGVMHRDLKPENFLFANKKETAALKTIDFGLSVFFHPSASRRACLILLCCQRFTEIVGSPYYKAPEVLKRNYGPEVDVWSAGVILYILLCGLPPFWVETKQGVAQAIIRSVIDFKRDPWPRVSDNAKDLVKGMLNPDPRRRLNAQQVLDHPWLQNIKKAPNVIAEHLSIEEVAGIKDMFETMDLNKDSMINFDELKLGLHKLGHQMADADVQILMVADTMEC
ncbi:hypothetical protein GUJ93_ZPchr0012g20793 [Zizania palustris]|uniref:Calcium-dependent protein kinase n=1 Tax=Zizania palustris TaxID=103762 RepID=A0A8J6BTM5_ZIZPA|nr:hypothetical protein GUJ93_ZPchr0012g20793 [Zizania palustris]